jgi:hypothetical protein
MVSLLSASVYQNVETGLQIFQHGIDPRGWRHRRRAVEYARRGSAGNPGHRPEPGLLPGADSDPGYAFGESCRQVDDPVLLGAMMRRALTVTFSFIDRVSQQVVTAYQEERDRWLFNRSAVRAARVRALLDGDGSLLDMDGVDVDATEAALGYRLRGAHLGMIAWQTADVYAGDTLGALETLSVDLMTRVQGEGRPLFVPRDESSAWVWLLLSRLASTWSGRLRAVRRAPAGTRRTGAGRSRLPPNPSAGTAGARFGAGRRGALRSRVDLPRCRHDGVDDR